jgi:uncharacterized protein (UPF0333 family)
MKKNRGQISLEYLILVGFVTFIIISTLAIAYLYSGSINDRIKVSQINNFAKKIVSTSERVFYQGEPSKATISVYLPDGVQDVSFFQNNLFVTLLTSSGTEKISISSDVPVEGSITSGMGIKKIEIRAEENKVIVSQI